MTKIIKTNAFPLMLVFFSIGLILTACGGADTSALELSQAEVATQAAVLQQEIASQQVIPATTEPSEPQLIADAGLPTELPIIPRIDLGADWFDPVNPIGVAIASGELQIIEFSAYW